jgi:hypothetical protein
VEAPLTPDRLLYLYGFVTPPVELADLTGVEDDVALELIHAGEIACVVSAVPGPEYQRSGGAASAARQLEWIAPRASRHHAVVCRLHAQTTIVPLKFGTLCSCADDVRALIGGMREQVLATLDRVRDNDEWTMRIQLDAGRTGALIEREDAELAALAAEERALPEGRAYFVGKRRQRRAADLFAAYCEQTADAIYTRLTEREVATICRDQARVGGSPLLVDRSRFASLIACLGDLESEFESSGLSLALQGPWPPFNFVNGRGDGRELTSGVGK